MLPHAVTSLARPHSVMLLVVQIAVRIHGSISAAPRVSRVSFVPLPPLFPTPSSLCLVVSLFFVSLSRRLSLVVLLFTIAVEPVCRRVPPQLPSSPAPTLPPSALPLAKPPSRADPRAGGPGGASVRGSGGATNQEIMLNYESD